jgi:Tfp pilus assembly protein PilF
MKLLQIIAGGLILSLALAPASVYAIGGGGSKPQPTTPDQGNRDYRSGVDAVKKQDWTTAIRYLEKAVASSPNNADAWNYLGYSYRKSGKLDQSFTAYEKALAIDPNHRGAREYLGEAYLQAGNLPKAKAQLDKLVQICGQNCKQTRELRQAIGAYQTGKPTPSPTW